jgi:hypothetical protein
VIALRAAGGRAPVVEDEGPATVGLLLGGKVREAAIDGGFGLRAAAEFVDAGLALLGGTREGGGRGGGDSRRWREAQGNCRGEPGGWVDRGGSGRDRKLRSRAVAEI